MFLLSQNDENQSENGSKNSIFRLRARPPAELQKKMLLTKKLRSKSWKTRVFSLFTCRFWTGAFTNRCLPYCFLQCFLKASVTTYQKQEVLAEKWDPPPRPGKPVTFYECHPDDHAPAPSVRADFKVNLHIWYSCICVLMYAHVYICLNAYLLKESKSDLHEIEI